MKYIFITNHPDTAKIAYQSGVQRFMVDLEIEGKQERQGHVDTFISTHQFSDISLIRKAVPDAEVLVRLNKYGPHTCQEVEQAVNLGADIIMQPFFLSYQDVLEFSEYIPSDIGFIPLFEHYAVLELLEEIFAIQKISEVYLGLNDLHLSRQQKFVFEPLANGDVDLFAAQAKAANFSFGFGGVAMPGEGDFSAYDVMKEHARLGSTRVILGRAFRKFFEGDSTFSEQEKLMTQALAKLTNAYDQAQRRLSQEVEIDRLNAFAKIKQIAQNI